ncbi:mRNA decapping protein 2, Box A [Ophiocordyceps camponoti-floridani]|uniref:mRNA decapping protein 2, Box A n=1 Tax=Ophiocordyceps camponoti-floridani TaxID=2030778 RepID=A0A8H4Q3R1_9HYPO|nr:mRNA decapping protein 2, Box A [Ophiocordyceps camponoti-floridani]
MAAPQMLLEDWLDDLCVRFIINLPQEDLSSVARICFQVEEAQWFYEDFVRPLDPTLPSMSLRTFCLRIFQHCPLLASFSAENHAQAFEEFLQYKTRVPVRGAIMLNQAMDSVVLVKGWKKGSSWSFPRGKINKDEDDLDCAIREVYEETGFDIRAAGLVPSHKPKSIEITMREQQLRLYVFRDIPMDTDFQPRTRKEISKIQWYKLSELPAFRKKGDKAAQYHDGGAGNQATKFYMVAPFLVPLKKWIASQKKINQKRAAQVTQANLAPQFSAPDEAFSVDDETWATDQRGVPDGPIPAETLSGATLGLQPLLKMKQQAETPQQPPQQSQPENKGSALLSILQAGSSLSRDMTNLPQTPLDLSVAEPPPLPRNPHHHTNQLHAASHETLEKGPPPSFRLGSNHEPVTLNAMPMQSYKYNPPRPPPHAAGVAQQQQRARRDISLAHQQPLLPQAMQDTLIKSASHGSPASYEANRVQLQPGQGQGPLYYMSSPAPTHHVAQDSRTAQLDGHSMTLMTIMNRDTTPAPPPYNNDSVQTHQASVMRPPYGNHGLQGSGLLPPQTRQSHSGPLERDTHGNQMPLVHRPAQAAIGGQTPVQPVRLLQRGQNLGDELHGRLPRYEGLANQPQSTQGAQTVRSSGAASRRTRASDEQKMQLLSLFGRPQNEASGGDRDQRQSGPAVVTSPQRERESGTPMSPADQSFVLEYLQSVTNNVGR